MQYNDDDMLVLPDPITPEFINSIETASDFKLFVNQMKWTGYGGHFKLAEILNKTLDACKIKAIDYLAIYDQEFEFPEVITSEYIMSITDFKILKDLISLKNWGGKGGHFILKDVKKSTLEKCKLKAIEILEKENIAARCKSKLEISLTTGKQIQKDGVAYIEDDKGYLFDVEKEIIEVPLRNCKKQLVGYAKISFQDFETVSEYTYHLKIDKRNYISPVSGQTNKSLGSVILGDIPKGYMIRYLNNDAMDARRENMVVLTSTQFNQAKPKKSGKFLSNYKGVSLINKKKLENIGSDDINTDEEESLDSDEDIYSDDIDEDSDEIVKNEYRAFISVEGKYVSIGNFPTEIEAAIAYDKYAFHYYGRYCGNNGLLTEKEIEDILNYGLDLDEDKAEASNLPKNIYKRYGKYYYSFSFNGTKYYKKVGKNLDKAISALKAKKEEVEEKFKTQEKIREDSESITRDVNGNAVIILRNRNGEKVGETKVTESIWRELNQYSWHMKDGYASGFINGENVDMNVYLYKTYIGELTMPTVDHINIDPLDNRLENLRPASHSLQNHNRNKAKDAIVRDLKGVTINGNLFVVNPYGERFSFEFLEDAVLKFNELAFERYGKEAKLNPIKEGKTRVIDLLKKEDITPEYIDSITHVELFKLVCKKMNWGGKGGKIKQSAVRASSLNEYREKAKKILTGKAI